MILPAQDGAAALSVSFLSDGSFQHLCKLASGREAISGILGKRPIHDPLNVSRQVGNQWRREVDVSIEDLG